MKFFKNTKILQEFRNFAVRGNVIDMAVGVIIGAAFGKIVSSFVADIIMPPLGLLIGGVDLKKFSLTLRAAHDGAPEVVMHYGMFLQNVFDFLIVAIAIFMMIKVINKLRDMQKQNEDAVAEATPPKLTQDQELLMEIRDLLKQNITHDKTAK